MAGNESDVFTLSTCNDDMTLAEIKKVNTHKL